MTPQETTDKIKQMPDGRTMLLFDHNPSCTISTNDLKSLVTRLEQAERNEKTLREAVELIAKPGEAEMRQALTLHYDMRGIARRVLKEK